MIPEIFEGFHIHHHKEVSSTNREALDLIDKEISNEATIIADKQTDGRGRTGKSWVSPKGNFCASLIIDLLHNRSGIIPTLGSRVTYWNNNRENLSKLTELTFVTAVAVGNTLSLFIGDSNIQYKWPNDILVDDKKISGILLEKKSNSNWLVIGIGINIDHTPLSEATCVSSYGKSVFNTDLLKELIINFNKLRKQWIFDGFYAIREMWLKRAFRMNEQISVKLAGKLHEGIFVDIDKSGRLVLQQKDESLIYSDAGELFVDSAL
ncbi:biotin--[acetyl-CoA-carboxylase] ligase [Wolbachia pipientis]|uniref:biotin--[acetyl-CoA-carboxylase] ligase n=1 Tax=Wolbachia pipientis TaxID=955 RepID=UPI00202E2B9B|nr:biotin--[acetyl-CoA-carboxylase] ligase [Wolbachia pipientis]